MFMTIEHFKKNWQMESDNTRKIFAALTDQTLNQSVADDHRTLGRMAWHIIQCLPEMANATGLKVEGPGEKAPVPTSADEIKTAYDKAAKSLMDQVTGNWKDETLFEEDNMYGETWARGVTLYILVKHEIHHRGQMTVLMRQAGLKCPGIYGPAKEEWVNYGGQPPEV
ncbi:MAG: hypothetical protein GY839_14685 [candidate division Zixibacteria bacterium]|nr:hypothetical protein [candidate division Zixibacteria bacterium]